LPEGLSVTLLDRQRKLSIGATWQFVWSNRRNEVAEYDLSTLQAKSHGTLLLTGEQEATVETTDTAQKKLTLANGKSIGYDTLVLSPGVVSKPALVEGLAESGALDICNRQHVPLIKNRLDTILRDASHTPKTIMVCVTRLPYKVRHSEYHLHLLLCDPMTRPHSSLSVHTLSVPAGAV
jgi:NADH dehydrogenase FAD-containing subunit